MDYKKIVVEVDGVRYALVPLDPPPMATRIIECGLSQRTVKVLQSHGIEYLERMLTLTEAELLRLPNFGRRALNEVKETLELRNLRVGQYKRRE